MSLPLCFVNVVIAMNVKTSDLVTAIYDLEGVINALDINEVKRLFNMSTKEVEVANNAYKQALNDVVHLLYKFDNN